MDNFGNRPQPKVKKKSPIWNILTLLMLLGTCCAGYYFFTVFQNPHSALNPFQPAAVPTAVETEIPTITNTPTNTSTSTPVPTSTRTKAPTWTPLPGMVTPSITETPTLTPLPGTQTITPTPVLATEKISFETSTTIHPESGCNWAGIGGKVLDANNQPILFQTLQLGGTLDDKLVNQLMLSGSAPAYGASGFEFVLGDHPIASTKTLWIQLFDNNRNQLTDKIYLDTSASCTQNLVLIVFTKTR